MDISGVSQAGLRNNATYTASDSLSANMLTLKQAVEKLDDNRFAQLLNNDIVDSGEVLMLLYCAVVCFNQERAFDILLKRDNYFKQKPEWNRIFGTPRVYACLKGQPMSPERRQFDVLTMREAFDRELMFMVEIVLERSRITPDLIRTLLAEDQHNMLVSLIAKISRPKFVDFSQPAVKGGIIQRELHFNDIVEVALEAKAKSQSVIHMIKRMKSEVAANYFDSPAQELNLTDLYRIFVQRRKLKLLRFLFSLQNEFNFTP